MTAPEHDPLCGTAATYIGTNYVYGCTCEVIAIARADERERAAERVEAVGKQHPKWDLMSTHYEDCWKHHSECALTLALAAIRTP